MIREYVKIFLFLSSYAPLFAILAIKNYLNEKFVLIMLLLILIPNFLLVFIIKKASTMSGEYYLINETDNRSDQFLEYIIAYIIPFLGFNFEVLSDIVAVTILFVLMGVLYIKNDLLYMNPTLNLMGYSLYRIKTDNEIMMLISKQEIFDKDKVRGYKISRNIGIVK